MKKLLLCSALCFATASVWAQEGPSGIRSSTDYGTGTNDSRNNGFGVKGGWNLSGVRGDNKSSLANRDNLNSFLAGIYAQFALNDKFSIQPEFLYSRKGYEADPASGAPATYTRKTQLDYLQVPVLFVYNFLDNVSVHIGPQAALLINAKNSTLDTSISQAGFHSLDYGAVGGLEARVGPARIGARYDLGLAKIRKASAMPMGDKLYNQAVQVYLGLGFSR
ncbi:porin family protein [Hymenobacter crusticola]|uniref:Outer membrane protein beta-barrel domain-containing protein n=1 Tax=Hymenobacter crusticola TaxID=1770526 RepID=A0A243WIY8_9BACT|nr:porin family protein [Hymenobacter crusticola]OUJ75862.1 hypothetical protein BXP70_00770 [Hymenobacter crusticola]